jgi:hypothetical protein
LDDHIIRPDFFDCKRIVTQFLARLVAARPTKNGCSNSLQKFGAIKSLNHQIDSFCIAQRSVSQQRKYFLRPTICPRNSPEKVFGHIIRDTRRKRFQRSKLLYYLAASLATRSRPANTRTLSLAV